MGRAIQRAAAMRFISSASVLSALFLSGISLGRGQSAQYNLAKIENKIDAQGLPTAPSGANRCIFCHTAEVEGYSRSAMAHSLRRAGQEPEGSVTAGGSTITMQSTPNNYIQRWENGGDAAEYRVDFVVGSGNHASGYLVTLGGHLFQSPVAYYEGRHAYGLAPGYENLTDPDFTRPVSEECVLCHSGTALHVTGTLNQYRSPIFSAEGITCERCHGPVEKHLTDPRVGTILNPAKLERGARDSICEQCHLFGVSRIPNPGKTLSDFVPGQRLEESYTVYHDASVAGAPIGDFKVISHVEQLALSVCARKSEGRFWCGTCHNPHEKPASNDALQYYRSRCLNCHTTDFPSAHPSKDSDCIACHMPRRDAKDGGHAAFTDHRIQKRPEPQRDSAANTEIAAWREPPPNLQKRNMGIAYIDVGMQRHSSPFIIQGYRTLTGVQQQFRDDPDFFKWIGEALLLGKKAEDAKFALERALRLAPNSALTEASAASPYIQQGDLSGAIAHLERAVELDPLNLPVSSTLIGLYQKEGKAAEASELSKKIKTAMNEDSGVTQSGENQFGNDSSKNAEDVYKNIQVLKGVLSNQLMPAMQFMTSSLGVRCDFCHVDGHFEKDDKKPKETARTMMKMVFGLNKSDFRNQREVTCYSCHRGSQTPVGTPLVATETSASAENTKVTPRELSSNLPSSGEVIERYIRALGGVAAIEKITSRVERGTASLRGRSVNVEISTKSPDKLVIVQHFSDGDATTGFDGNTGWASVPGRPARELHDAEIETAHIDANLQLPLQMRQLFPDLRVEYPEKIDQLDVNVLISIRPGQPAMKFYFDKQTGLLVRLILSVESPLGSNPTRVDYADYREVDGVQMPFHVTVSQPGSRSIIQLKEVRQNAPIDDAIFSKPKLDRSPAKSVPPR